MATDKEKKNLLRVSLCDSKNCNQRGGGEYMKADIEDLVTLTPGVDTARVQLTTCLGHCNRSPNVSIHSRGDVLLYTPTTRKRHLEHNHDPQQIVNDGGFRMRVVEEEETTNGNTYYTTSHKVIVNNINISKVAYALGIWDQPQAVKALECKAAGNREKKEGNYKEALQNYMSGRAELAQGNSTIRKESKLEYYTSPQEELAGVMQGNSTKIKESLSTLEASLWLCCIQCRIKWAIATDTNNVELLLSPSAATQHLRLAISDALKTLEQNNKNTATKLHSVIATLLQTAHKMNIGNPQNPTHAPVTKDDRILALLCLALADGWSALAELEEEDDAKSLQQAALEGYIAIQETICTGETKLLKLRERRRVERSIEALRNAQQETSWYGQVWRKLSG